MKKRIVDGSTERGKRYPIQPRQINVKNHLHGAFNTVDAEIAAGVLVKFAQRKGVWLPFSIEDIKVYGDGHFNLRSLSSSNPYDEENYIIRGQDQRYYFTHEFIMKCAEVALIF